MEKETEKRGGGRRRKVLISISIILISISSISIGIVSAQPPIPCEFYGNVTIDDAPAPIGTHVVAKIDGVERGNVTTTEVGKYGGIGTFDERLIVNGTEEDEGETITFFVNGVQASCSPEGVCVWNSGESKRVDLDVSITTNSNGGNGAGASGSGGSGGSTVITPTPTSTPTPTTTAAAPAPAEEQTASPEVAQPSSSPSQTTTPEQSKKGLFEIPGFELISALLAMLVILSYLRLSKEERWK